MTSTTRRNLLTGAAALGGVVVGGAAVGASLTGLGAQAFAEPATDGGPPPPGPAKIGKDDDRYAYLASRRVNPRFDKQPEYFHVVASTDQVVAAVEEAVKADKRITVRSGGHCMDNLVDNDQVVIDMSAMTALYFDDEHRAFSIAPGLTLTEVYRRLYLGWGVTIPAGTCPGVGAGGHIVGGGYGSLSRTEGLSVDHLYGVEVVTVDADGAVKATVATRDPDDPHHDLWWAHTGGGGGNFGIVTRYLMRTPDVASEDPADLLPRPPADVIAFSVIWNWADLDKEQFSRLATQYGTWHEHNSAPGAPGTALHAVLMLHSPIYEVVVAAGMVRGDTNADAILDDFLATVGDGVAEPTITRERVPWLTAAMSGLEETDGDSRSKIKSTHKRTGFTADQVEVLWEHLSDPEPSHAGSVWLVSYGGQVNTIDPEATAVAHRSSILKAIYVNGWQDPEQDRAQLEWLRNLYSDVYADTGGVPEPGEANDGCYINYPDVDLADPDVNSSGVAWHELYYGDNYPRLRAVKGTWDPRNVVHHDLSIELP